MIDSLLAHCSVKGCIHSFLLTPRHTSAVQNPTLLETWVSCMQTQSFSAIWRLLMAAEVLLQPGVGEALGVGG